RFDLLWSYVLILFFLWLALKSKRHFPLFFIVSFPFTVKFFINHLNLPSNLAQTIKNSLLLRIYSVLGLVLLSIFFFVSAEYTNEPFTAEKYCLSYPCDGIDFVKGEPAYRDLKIFNNYSWGGFMIWVWPEKPLFIDGRLPQFDFAGHTILEEYHDFFKKEKTSGLLEKYGIEMVFIDQAKEYRFTWFEKYLLRLKNDDIKKINSDFLEYMNNADRWKLVYEDNICLIYAKI
ncbi:MAG: hypothetical protein MUC28_01395, partial [Planctomycetes bacterium]|nr:hypothetical protein [Planctomycetota bacterium]